MANDGEDALKLTQHVAYDLIILDVMLPKLTGLNVCRSFRLAGKGMPVLLLTVGPLPGRPCMVCEPPRNPIMLKPMIHGVSSCTSETPKLPIPAWSPSAVPCRRRGKK